MKTRPEPFGAFVALERPPALVAVDRTLAQRMGIDGGALWDGPDPGLALPVLTAPTEVHLAATERCPAGCRGCYADAKPDGHEPTFDALAKRLDALAALGVFSVAFGGGESALRGDIGDLARHARRVGLSPTMTTSGLGISAARASDLDAFAQINVSWDGPAEVYRAVRGYDGAAAAERAIAHLVDAGVTVGINTVVTRRSFPHLDAIAAGAEELGAVELQLLRYKPSGRGRLDYLTTRLTHAQVDAFGARVRHLAEAYAPAVRIDCAMVPFLVADGEIDARELERFGVMGCEAGRSLMTLDARGGARPCSFWEGATEPSPPADAWRDDETLGRFRAYVASVPEPCASCAFLATCRGGCRIVAGHGGPSGGGAFSPDPECPRVVAFNEGGRRSASSTGAHGD